MPPTPVQEKKTLNGKWRLDLYGQWTVCHSFQNDVQILFHVKGEL